MVEGVDSIHVPDLLGQCQNILVASLRLEWVADINIKAPYLVQKTKTCSRTSTKNPPLLIPVPCRQVRIIGSHLILPSLIPMH